MWEASTMNTMVHTSENNSVRHDNNILLKRSEIDIESEQLLIHRSII